MKMEDGDRSLSRSTTESEINRIVDIKIEIEFERELDIVEKNFIADWIECQFEKEDSIELFRVILSTVDFEEIMTDVNEKGNVEIDIRVLLRKGLTIDDFEISKSLLAEHSFPVSEDYSGDSQSFVQLIIDSCNHPLIEEKNIKVSSFFLSYEFRDV